jgi:tRNA(Ile)-lysidine synthase
LLRQAVAATIDHYAMIERGQTVLVAVSGGPDSLTLLDVLADLAAELNLRLAVAHLDHGLRPDSADDAEFVAGVAASLGLECFRERVDLPAILAGSGESPEAVARSVRYAFLARAAATIGADRIALGHNADDQAETVIMRLLRGSGSDGLAGIPPVRLPYVRPLIRTPRAAIEEYCRQRDLHPRLDSTNAESVYLRNRLRHQLLPQMREYNPRLTEALGELAERQRAESAYLRDAAEEALSELQNADGLDCAALAGRPTALQRAVLRIYHERETGELPVAYHHIERLRALIAAQRGQHQLPGGHIARVEYGRLAIIPVDAGADAFSIAPTIPGLTHLPIGEALLVWVTGPTAATFATANAQRQAFLDCDAIPDGAVIRTRHPGDRIRIAGVGSKKLQDVLIDAKVPRRRRDRLPLLACGGDILWVPGIRVAEGVAITPVTRAVLAFQLVPDDAFHCSDNDCMLE